MYISHTHIVAASKTSFFVWYYRTTSRLAAPELTQVSSRKGREGHDRLIHADDHPSDASPPTVDFKKATIVSDESCILCSFVGHNEAHIHKINVVATS